MYFTFLETMSYAPISEQIASSMERSQLYATLVSMKVSGVRSDVMVGMAKILAKKVDLNLDGVQNVTDYTLECMRIVNPFYRSRLPNNAFSLTPLIYQEHSFNPAYPEKFAVTILPMDLYYGALSAFSFDLQLEAGISPLRLNARLQEALGEEYELEMEPNACSYTNHIIRKTDGSELSPEDREFIRNSLNNLQIRNFDTEKERMHLPQDKMSVLVPFDAVTQLHDGVLSISFQSKAGEQGPEPVVMQGAGSDGAPRV